MRLWFLILFVFTAFSARAQDQAGLPPMPEQTLEDALAVLSLDCINREYPNKISHMLTGDADLKPPRELHPIFYGCYDWHSAVHSHWLLVRLLKDHPNATYTVRARAALNASFTAEKALGELVYFATPGRGDFERPYGLAWFLRLMADLKSWNDPDAKRWAAALAPIEETIVRRLYDWMPKLAWPSRIGTHGNTAFPSSLALDYARIAGKGEFETLILERAKTWYGENANCRIDEEPSANDFLSSCLSVADLMRRVLPPAEFSRWLTRFLPDIPKKPGKIWLLPVVPPDRSDGQFVHLDGLNISRAWALRSVAAALPAKDPRRATLLQTAIHHADAGLSALVYQSYEGTHWLGSFIIYLQATR